MREEKRDTETDIERIVNDYVDEQRDCSEFLEELNADELRELRHDFEALAKTIEIELSVRGIEFHKPPRKNMDTRS